MGKVIGECSRILRRGGQFVQTMNLEKSMFEFYHELENTLEKLEMQDTILLMHNHIREKRKPLDEVNAMLEQQDFYIKNTDHHQFRYRFTNATAMFNHYFIRLAFMEAWKTFLPENKTGEIFAMVEENLNRQADLSGGFTLSIPFAVIDAVRK